VTRSRVPEAALEDGPARVSRSGPLTKGHPLPRQVPRSPAPAAPQNVRMTLRSRTAQRPPDIAGGAAVLGGLTWTLLVPAAELVRRDLLSYDGYNRLLAVPLLLFTVALSSVPRALTVRGRLALTGFSMAATGTALLLVGNVVEFYGVLLQDGLNAYAASQAGADEHWIGSDIGWMTFGVGMLVLLAGGIVAALALHRSRTAPVWLILFTCTLGVGVLAANLLGLAPAFLSVPVLMVYAAGWVAFGRLLLRSRAVP
jgi:hypothetical protein